MTQAVLDRLRALCLSLPETSESDSWGHPNFRAGKKIFAAYEIYHERPCVAVKLPVPDGTALLDDPRFFRTPYVGKHGWISVWVDDPPGWPLLRELVLTSYRQVALKRMLAALDGEWRSRVRKKA